MKSLIKSILYRFIRLLGPTSHVQYFRFGFNPSGYLREDFVNCFFGTRNLLKHYQAPVILRALNIGEGHTVLDLGCGVGNQSVEVAKLAKFTIGADINPEVETLPIPDFLSTKLHFRRINHFKDLADLYGECDRILLSEVILSVPNMEELLDYCHKLLAKDGRLVIVNGLGKFYIRDRLYKRRWMKDLFLKVFSNMPNTYAEYENALCGNFDNKAVNFLAAEDIKKRTESRGFAMLETFYAPCNAIGSLLEVKQFIDFLRNRVGTGLFQLLFLRITCSLLSLHSRPYLAGFVGVFKKC